MLEKDKTRIKKNFSPMMFQDSFKKVFELTAASWKWW